MKTPQEIFDTTLFHLRNQGVAAMSIYSGYGDLDEIDQLRCAYRGEGGTMCAVGCHIPDRLYSPTLEGMRVEDLPMLRDLGLSDSKDLLTELQHLHDGTLERKGLQAWEEGMKKLATLYGLVYKPA